MQIQQATIDDLQELRELGIASWSQYREHLDADSWQKLLRNVSDLASYQHLLDSGTGFLCKDELGQTVGMAFMIPSGTATDIYQAEWCQLRFVTVHPAASGRGIGRALVERCIAEARLQAEHTMALHSSELMLKARRIYESMGFQLLREIDQRFGQRYWLYTLRL